MSGARLTWRGRDATIAAHTVEPLPEGVVVPALATPNINDVPLVGRAIAQVVERLGGRARRAALVVPDTVAKVSLIRFEKVPAKAADLAELVRWQIRKTAPFPIDQAIVSFTPGARASDGSQEFVVTLARTDIVMQYEEACSRAGLHAGLVDLATFSAINSVLAGSSPPAGDWLLVHATPTYTTLTVMRDRDLIFFRNRDEETEGTLADVVHQTAMYYEDRLKGAGFSRVLLTGWAAMPGERRCVGAQPGRASWDRGRAGRPANVGRVAGSHRRLAGVARCAGAARRDPACASEGWREHVAQAILRLGPSTTTEPCEWRSASALRWSLR